MKNNKIALAELKFAESLNISIDQQFIIYRFRYKFVFYKVH